MTDKLFDVKTSASGVALRGTQPSWAPLDDPIYKAPPAINTIDMDLSQNDFICFTNSDGTRRSLIKKSDINTVKTEDKIIIVASKGGESVYLDTTDVISTEALFNQLCDFLNA